MLWFGQGKKNTKGTRRGSLVNTQRRHPILAKLLYWARRAGVVVGSVGLVLWAGAWLWLSGTAADWKNSAHNTFIEASVKQGYAVKNMMVEGRDYVDSDVLMALLNTEQGDPILSFHPEEARANIERLSWVEKVQVRRQLPDTIYITIEEKQPIALWKKAKDLKIVDSKGRIVHASNLDRFKDFLILTGQGAPKNAPALVSRLHAEKVISQRVETAQRISNRRWDIFLSNGIVVKLPETDIGLALRKLADAQKREGILDKDIKAIDLRQTDRMIVQTRPGAVEEYKASVKDASGKDI